SLRNSVFLELAYRIARETSLDPRFRGPRKRRKRGQGWAPSCLPTFLERMKRLTSTTEEEAEIKEDSSRRPIDLKVWELLLSALEERSVDRAIELFLAARLLKIVSEEQSSY
ncbi:hypothetical protein KEJ19_01325, partial [Candidatus Bathyarchaeota archaeon]|nr:hypothetical protein [Candidatus Bathyarchaeota archaeon]